MRSLTWNNGELAPDASMLCLILASCRCDRVPALLFLRPYLAQRRWSITGEISLLEAPGAKLVPQWPRSLWLSKSTLGERRAVSSTVTKLCNQGIIHVEVNEDEIFFALDEARKSEIWLQTSTEDRLSLWFDLLKLTIYSCPDVYAEYFWSTIMARLECIIDSTVLPFLSILHWEQLRYHQPM